MLGWYRKLLGVDHEWLEHLDEGGNGFKVQRLFDDRSVGRLRGKAGCGGHLMAGGLAVSGRIAAAWGWRRNSGTGDATRAAGYEQRHGERRNAQRAEEGSKPHLHS